MKGLHAFFSLLAKIWFLLIFIEVVKWIWNSGWIGKLILLTMLAVGIYQAHFSKPPMIHLPQYIPSSHIKNK